MKFVKNLIGRVLQYLDMDYGQRANQLQPSQFNIITLISENGNSVFKEKNKRQTRCTGRQSKSEKVIKELKKTDDKIRGQLTILVKFVILIMIYFLIFSKA